MLGAGGAMSRSPDPTSRFNCGDDVFVRHKDGRYYLGTVTRTSPSADRWLVRFGDNTEWWAKAGELKLLASDAAPLCVVCKRGGLVRVCDGCARPYHPSCHSPPLPEDRHPPHPPTWHCARCIRTRVTLPYDISTLHWDEEHKTNEENLYCYCGLAGDWFAQMLQCARCKQWFHQNCLSSVRYPVYSGDRFYMFVCSLCNFGTEFLGRLEMDWVDLVHLMLFNLTMYHSKKYFDLDTVVLPYLADNWYALHLSQKMSSATSTERRDFVVAALLSYRNRFKSGREIKKRTNIWGLRSRTPPPAPNAPLPRGLLTERSLPSKWGRLAFVPFPRQEIKSGKIKDRSQMIVPVDSHWKLVMMGYKFQSSSCSDAESSRSTPSPMSEVSVGCRLDGDAKKSPFPSKGGDESDSVSNEDLPLSDRIKTKSPKPKEYKFYSMDFQGGGLVKKSVPFPKLPVLRRKKGEDSVKSMRKRRHRSDIEKEKEDFTNRNRRKKIKIQKSLSCESANADHSEDTFTMIENDSSKADGNFEGSLKCTEIILPPTPPTSMSAPPTPPPVAPVQCSGSNSSDANTEYQSQPPYKKDLIDYDSDHDLADFKKDKKKTADGQADESDFREKSPAKNGNSDVPVTGNGISVVTHSLKTTAINLEISKLSTKNIIEHSKIMSLRHIRSDDVYTIFSKTKGENDSSGDDTSSRGTLDSIIPHPANFRGKNNPFHNIGLFSDHNKNMYINGLVKGHGFSIASKLFSKHGFLKNNAKHKNKCQRISLPVSLNPVIPSVKLMKRQLCEKDLIIGPNGEVKRRRHRRSKTCAVVQRHVNTVMNERQKSLRSSLNHGESNKNAVAATETPQRPDYSDPSINIRCLRQRQEKNYCDRRRGSTCSNNPVGPHASIPSNISVSGRSLKVKMNGVRSFSMNSQNAEHWSNADDISDLKSSVHSYFGASNRIISGEKFALVGKRVTENGKIQYLIEWEGHSS